MGVEVHCRQMFCNTTDVHFGPTFASDDEVEAFIGWIRRRFGCDPRQIPEPALAALKDIRALLEESRREGHHKSCARLVILDTENGKRTSFDDAKPCSCGADAWNTKVDEALGVER